MMDPEGEQYDIKEFKKAVQIRKGFEQWKIQQKREELLAKGENPDEHSFDEGQGDEGVNIRNGFPTYKPVMNHKKNLCPR